MEVFDDGDEADDDDNNDDDDCSDNEDTYNDGDMPVLLTTLPRVTWWL